MFEVFTAALHVSVVCVRHEKDRKSSSSGNTNIGLMVITGVSLAVRK